MDHPIIALAAVTGFFVIVVIVMGIVQGLTNWIWKD